MTKSVEAYIDQRTRQLIAGWADYCIRTNKGLPDLDLLPDTQEIERWARANNGMHPAVRECVDLGIHREYMNHAINKGWVGKTVKDGRRHLTSSGWNTAAAFLKR